MYTDFSFYNFTECINSHTFGEVFSVFYIQYHVRGFFPHYSDGKESVCNARDLGSVPGSGRSPGGRNGNSLQYSCLENPMDREAWQVAVLGVAKSQTALSE